MHRPLTWFRPAAAVLVFLISPVSHVAFADELDKLAKELSISLWDKSYGLRTGVGYKDNVLLSHSQPRSSPYVTSGLDIEWFRLPADGWQYYFLVTGDDIRYWHDIGVGNEDLWTSVANIKKDFGNDWKAGLSALYIYENQVVDISGDAVNGLVSPMKIIGHTATINPSLRWNLGANYWIELAWGATRQFLSEPADSYTRLGPKITLGRSYGNRSQFTVNYEFFDQRYDHAGDTDPSGNEIPGTTLWELRHRVELALRHNWDAKRLWQTTTKLTFDYNRDNGSGYYDYYKYGLSEQLYYHAKTWEIKGTAAVAHYYYPLQNVDIATRLRWHKTGLVLNLRGEKHLARWLKLFTEYEYEHSISNRTLDDYGVNTISGGVQWDF
jgi:hypothetical protein